MIHKLTDAVYGVKVPEGAYNFVTDIGYLIFKILDTSDGFPLPPVHWSIVGLVSEISEEQAKGLVFGETHVEIVDYNAGGGGRIEYNLYQDYEHGDCDCDAAIESLHSFARSVGVEAERLLIVKK